MQDIKALKAENIFVVLSLIMGLFYLVINPPFQAPDEAQHMFKMWGYTQGTLRFKVLQNYTGDVLPLSLIKLSRYEFMRGDTNKKITVNEIKQSLNVKLDKENKAFYTFNPTSYTPVSYFPSFLLLWVMKLLNIAPLVMMYMLRLCSLFLYTGLMYYAIKIMPVKKWLFFTLALLPMPLYTAASVSTDALFTGIVFIFIAYCSRLALRPRKGRVLRRKHYLVIGVLSLLISICKFAYMPLVLLYFIIPKDRFSSQKHRYGAFFAILLINLLVTGMFLDYSINAAKGLNTGTQGYEALLYCSVLTGFWVLFLKQFLSKHQNILLALSANSAGMTLFCHLLF